MNIVGEGYKESSEYELMGVVVDSSQGLVQPRNSFYVYVIWV
jgi:hypothetical protein